MWEKMNLFLGFSWISSPACTELEMVMMNWLGKMLQLPEVIYLKNVKHNMWAIAVFYYYFRPSCSAPRAMGAASSRVRPRRQP